MTKTTLIIASLVACCIYTVLAANNIPPRSFTSCGYVGSQIYCFGGDIASSFSGASNIDENIYSLNISQFIGNKSDIMSGQWNRIEPEVIFFIGERRAPTSTVLSDGKRFMIQGGYNVNRNKYVNQTIIYDTSSNSWSKGTPFIGENGESKQNYYATAVNLPNNSIGFYGGFDQLANLSAPEITGTGNLGNFDSGNRSIVGFSSFTMLNTESGKWSAFSPQSSTLTEFYPSFQTATFNPSTGKIYYLGGSYYTAGSTGKSTRVPFHWAAVFDTNTGTWSNETLHGDAPTNRLYHTANLLNNSEDVVLYGGSNDGLRASDDYCYTLNLKSNTWTKNENVNVPSQLSGPRFSHSTVLVNSSLFILFGRGYTGDLSYSLLTIDVSDVSNIVYTDTYASTVVTDEKVEESAGLSKGAIGGIAAGSIVAGLAIIALFFYLRRQKKRKQGDTQEQMAVDWDEIEDHYKELPVAASTNGDTSVPHHSANLIMTNEENNNKFSRSNNMVPDATVDIVKPSVNSVDEYTTLKPDVQ